MPVFSGDLCGVSPDFAKSSLFLAPRMGVLSNREWASGANVLPSECLGPVFDHQGRALTSIRSTRCCPRSPYLGQGFDFFAHGVVLVEIRSELSRIHFQSNLHLNRIEVLCPHVQERYHDGYRDLFHCGELSGRSGPALEVLREGSRVGLAGSRSRAMLDHAHGGGGILALKYVSRQCVSLLYST